MKPLEEIIAEKLRAILQTLQTFERRGWVRSRARDYYDLWRILSTYKNELNLSGFSDLVYEKCKAREITFTNYRNFFSENLLEVVEKSWKQWLGSLISQLPPYKRVIDELRAQVKELLI